MRLLLLTAFFGLSAFLDPVSAQELKLGDIRAHLYLESSGKLSDDIISIKGAKLINLPRGEGIFAEPVNTVIINISLLGSRNSQPKFSTAMVNITTTNRTGQKKTETRPLMGLVFGEEGRVNRAVVLENITCSKVEVEVKTRNASKRVNLDFECTDPKSADASDKALTPQKR